MDLRDPETLTLDEKFEIIIKHHYGTPTHELAGQYRLTRQQIRDMVIR